ncbi:hypothetical protein ADIS_1265 [Lunatimonas lonarensis]|uniref:Uncharacterized protein n=2 Tax=Lunatimonas lonarensis TaxID=1232681 RepID=R7ZVM2_9BACT|nr:hypothetical protein ADIS_1265 [Lunatimonas lonarensis]
MSRDISIFTLVMTAGKVAKRSPDFDQGRFDDFIILTLESYAVRQTATAPPGPKTPVFVLPMEL